MTVTLDQAISVIRSEMHLFIEYHCKNNIPGLQIDEFQPLFNNPTGLGLTTSYRQIPALQLYKNYLEQRDLSWKLDAFEYSVETVWEVAIQHFLNTSPTQLPKIVEGVKGWRRDMQTMIPAKFTFATKSKLTTIQKRQIINYIQSEFAKRDIPLPGPITLGDGIALPSCGCSADFQDSDRHEKDGAFHYILTFEPGYCKKTGVS